jgi:hypothetical protein
MSSRDEPSPAVEVQEGAALLLMARFKEAATRCLE